MIHTRLRAHTHTYVSFTSQCVQNPNPDVSPLCVPLILRKVSAHGGQRSAAELILEIYILYVCIFLHISFKAQRVCNSVVCLFFRRVSMHGGQQSAAELILRSVVLRSRPSAGSRPSPSQRTSCSRSRYLTNNSKNNNKLRL